MPLLQTRSSKSVLTLPVHRTTDTRMPFSFVNLCYEHVLEACKSAECPCLRADTCNRFWARAGCVSIGLRSRVSLTVLCIGWRWCESSSEKKLKCLGGRDDDTSRWRRWCERKSKRRQRSVFPRDTRFDPRSCTCKRGRRWCSRPQGFLLLKKSKRLHRYEWDRAHFTCMYIFCPSERWVICSYSRSCKLLHAQYEFLCHIINPLSSNIIHAFSWQVSHSFSVEVIQASLCHVFTLSYVSIIEASCGHVSISSSVEVIHASLCLMINSLMSIVCLMSYFYFWWGVMSKRWRPQFQRFRSICSSCNIWRMIWTWNHHTKKRDAHFIHMTPQCCFVSMRKQYDVPTIKWQNIVILK